MIPKKGHLIEYQNLDPSKYDYILRINIGDKKICYYMHDSRILCGLTMKEDESRIVDLKVIQEIKDIHKSVARKLGLDAKAKL